VQDKETINYGEFADLSRVPSSGRLLALDPGTKRIGVAVSDEDRMVFRPLQFIERTSWKSLLSAVLAILNEFDAKALVIGLPLEFDGLESNMSREARSLARKFGLSLEVPVFLQDERATSYEAKSRLWASGNEPKASRTKIDSEAAVIILSDFVDRLSLHES
jgi:putative holliday junction resolvase